ncbi:MAG: GntR family transcriptional regulator [Ktedonobacteraceae bacterium]|nr:GntR family transcriptional regulator [Ktedonobacteraceae bacterium]
MSKKQTTVTEVAEALRTRVLAGDFGQFGRLPPAIDLATEYHVSRDTINRAIRLLQAEGYLESRGEGKRGMTISRSRVRIQGITARFDLELLKLGLVPIETNIDEPAIVPAPPQVAQALGVGTGTPVVRRFRKQGAEQAGTAIPYRLAENFYPTVLADEAILAQMQRDDRFDVILAIREKHGKAPARLHEDVIGRLPTSQERQLLNITAQTPVLEVNRVSYAEDDTVIMINKIIFVANLFVLSYDYPTGHWKK